MSEWVSPAITGISSIIVALITVWVKNRYDVIKANKDKHVEENIQESDLGEMIFVNDYIESMRLKYDFDRISICQFHNGGKFFNGKSMKKFSMTYESSAPGYAKQKRDYQNILVSEYPDVIQSLFIGETVVSTLDDVKDSSYHRDMELNGILQCIKIPVLGLSGGLAGFIMCHNISKTIKIDENIGSHLIDDANQLSGYLIK